MLEYLVRRLLLIIPTLFLVTLIVFFSARFIPGDVVEMMIAEMGAEAAVADIELTLEVMRHRLGIDIPVHEQYGRWMGFLPQADGNYAGIFQGTLGGSLWTGRDILKEIVHRLPISVELGIIALTSGVLISIPIGTYSALRQDTAGDYVGRTFAILAISVPSFWIGTMVMVYPSIWWQWMPPLEFSTLWENPTENLKQFLIPGIIMGLVASGAEMRMMRTMMLEVLRQDYIRTAWSKGLNERTVVMRHALKNALIPVVTIIGLHIPVLIGGSVIMETIFNLPGVGRLLIEALTKRDYPIISGLNIVMATTVLLSNLLVDISYGWMDPRVKFK